MLLISLQKDEKEINDFIGIAAKVETCATCDSELCECNLLGVLALPAKFFYPHNTKTTFPIAIDCMENTGTSNWKIEIEKKDVTDCQMVNRRWSQ